MYYHGQKLLERTDKEEWISPSVPPYIHTHVSTVCHLNTAMISQKWSFNHKDKIIVTVKCGEIKIFC